MEQEVKYKICKRCGEKKLVTEFNKDRTRKDGFNPYCKQCVKERADWKNPKQRETRTATNRRLYKENESYRQKVLAYNKKYREEHKEYFEEYCASEKFKESLKRNNKKRQESGEQKRYLKERRKEDKSFALACSLRSRVKGALKGTYKTDCTFNLISCSLEELKRHLESQFVDGMSWDNFGGKTGWQVDHIVPCSYFDLSIEENQRICFNFRNLQPLWAKDNNQKKNKLPENYLERIEGIKSYLIS